MMPIVSQLRNSGMVRSGRSRIRRGALLVAVVVCLSIVLTMILSMSVLIVRVQREARRELWRAQAEELVTAGLRRAIARRNEDPKYSGESWRCPVPSGTGAAKEPSTESTAMASEVAHGLVTIRIASSDPSETSSDPSGNTASDYQCEVIARYPEEDPSPVQIRETFKMSDSRELQGANHDSPNRE